MYREQPILKETVEVVDANTGVVASDLPACVEEVASSGETAADTSSHSDTITQSAPVCASAGATYSGTSEGGAGISKDSIKQAVGKRLAILSLASASFLTYFSAHYIAGNLFYQTTGIQTTEYMHATTDASTVGALLCFICTIRLMRSLGGLKDYRWMTIMRGVLALATLLIGFSSYKLVGLTVAALCIIAYLVVGWLGRSVRQAMPASYRFGRALMLAGIASLPAAAFSLYSFWEAFQNYNPGSGPSIYSDHVPGELAGMTVLIGFLVAVPTYAMARNARTSEAKPLITLGLIQQSPLLIGLMAQAAFAPFSANGLPMLLAMSGAIAMTAAITAFGAGAAAKVNGIKHRRRMAKSGGSFI